MGSCIALAIRIGIPDPSAVHASVETGSSATPLEIFPMVFAVQGAMRMRSTLFGDSGETSSTCSTLPVNLVIGGFPVDHSKIIGETNSAAFGVRTGMTSQPWRIKSLAILGASVIEMEPVTQWATLFPESSFPSVPVMSLRYTICWDARRVIISVSLFLFAFLNQISRRENERFASPSFFPSRFSGLQLIALGCPPARLQECALLDIPLGVSGAAGN